MKHSTLLLAAALVAAAPTLAAAHAVMSPNTAAPGGYYAGELRISHGCDGSPTVSVTVSVPEGIASAKPQPKPGWTLTIKREPLAAPSKGEAGQVIKDRATQITWKGHLPDDEFETFGLMLKLPPTSGPIYLPVVQACETGENRWTDIPAAGAAWNSVPRPAPVIILAAPTSGAVPGMDHDHHH